MRQRAKYAVIAYSHKTDMPNYPKSLQIFTLCFFLYVSGMAEAIESSKCA